MRLEDAIGASRSLVCLLVAFVTLLATTPTSSGAAVNLVEEHSEVLVSWLGKGIRHAALVNVDAHVDCRPIDADCVGRLRRLYAARDLGAITRANSGADEGLYHIGDFISAAAALGVVREAYWVPPLTMDRTASAAELRQSLVRQAVPPGDVASFRYRDGILSGPFGGTVLHVCSLASLPTLPGPVILSVDTDFVPAYAATRGVRQLDAAALLVGRLLARGYDTVDVSVAFSVNGGYTPVVQRWLGHALARGLEGRNVTAGGENVFRLLQRVEDVRTSAGPRAVVELLGGARQLHRRDPHLGLYLAEAYYVLGETERAFDLARKSAAREAGCAWLLPDLARHLANEGRLVQARRFIGEAPGIFDWRAELSLALGWMERRCHRHALSCLQAIRRRVASFSIEFLLGHAYLMMGDRPMAARHASRAADRLKTTSFPEPHFPRLGAAVLAAVDLLEAEGDLSRALSIRTDARLRHLFEGTGE